MQAGGALLPVSVRIGLEREELRRLAYVVRLVCERACHDVTLLSVIVRAAAARVRVRGWSHQHRAVRVRCVCGAVCAGPARGAAALEASYSFCSLLCVPPAKACNIK